MLNLSYENEFGLQFHFHANQSHFHNNGFALRLALKQRHKGTRKWPIEVKISKPAARNWISLLWELLRKCFGNSTDFHFNSKGRFPPVINIKKVKLSLFTYFGMIGEIWMSGTSHTSANFIYCITCNNCKKRYILVKQEDDFDDPLRENLRSVARNDKVHKNLYHMTRPAPLAQSNKKP